MSFPRYAEYKDSGIEWLDEVPAHWVLKRVRHLLRDGYDGLKIGPFGSQLTSDMLEEAGQFKVYGQENVIADDFERGQRYIGEAKFEELSVYEIRPGDLLVTMMGTSGRCGVAPEGLPQGIMDSHLLRMRVNESVLALFVRMLIDEAAYVSHQVKVAGKGSIMHGLNSGIVRDLLIALPSRPEQELILGFLDRETAKIDALVAEQEKLIALLKEKRQAVISHAVTKGLDAEAPMKDSGIEWLGEVPAHWEIGRIKTYLSTTSGATPNTSQQELYYADEDGGIPWVRTTDLQNDVLRSVDIFITQKALTDTACSILPPGTVMVAMYGGDGTVGKNGLLAIPAAINQAVCALLPSPTHNAEFVWRFMQFYRPHWMIGAESSRKDPNISQERVRNAPLPKPPRKEQDAIVEFLARELRLFDELMAEAHHAIGLLRERRSSLISVAVTGKIDVRSIASQPAQGLQELAGTPA